MGCHYAREHVHTPLLYLGNGWTDCAQICYVSRNRHDMWLRQSNWGVSARAQLHTPPLFRVLAWIGWLKVDDCGISRGNFQPTWHVQVTLRHLSCARSFIAHKALYWLLRYWNLLRSQYVNSNLNFQNFRHFFLFQNFPPQNQKFQKTVPYVRGQWLMNMYTKFQVDIFKNGWDMTSNMSKTGTFHVISGLYRDFPNFIFWPILMLQKVF